MDSSWAANHLQAIRTLMERSALYRRALAPILIFVGVMGIAFSVIDYFLNFQEAWKFIAYWLCVGMITLAGATIMVRRQAIANSEPFWSPPTRRVAESMIPPLLVGFFVGLVAIYISARLDHNGDSHDISEYPIILLIALWLFFYGLAAHAAGFFMPRGMKLFGWMFIIFAIALVSWVLIRPDSDHDARLSPLSFLMGFLFGASHLAYGIYLYFSEPRKNET